MSGNMGVESIDELNVSAFSIGGNPPDPATSASMRVGDGPASPSASVAPNIDAYTARPTASFGGASRGASPSNYRRPGFVGGGTNGGRDDVEMNGIKTSPYYAPYILPKPAASRTSTPRDEDSKGKLESPGVYTIGGGGVGAKGGFNSSSCADNDEAGEAVDIDTRLNALQNFLRNNKTGGV